MFQALPAHLMTFKLYWALEFTASFLSTGMVATGFIYNIEWTTTKYRVRLNNITWLMDIGIPYIAISTAAWYFQDNFIAFRLILAVPGFVMIPIYFVLGESPQWLLAQNRYDCVVKCLKQATRLNGRPLQPQTIQRIQQLSAVSRAETVDKEHSIKVSIFDVLGRKTLALRLVVSSVLLMFVYFALFGILFGSTKVHQNKYISFIVIGLADIPATIVNELLLNRIGRRLTIGLALPIYSLMLLVSVQLSDGHEMYRLILFFVGKTAIMSAMIGIYTYFSEFWPTSIRGTAFSISKTVGRLGSVFASMSVIMADIYVYLPLLLYATSATLGAVLLFAFLPETMDCPKLPDTIEEALAIGRKNKKNIASDKEIS